MGARCPVVCGVKSSCNSSAAHGLDYVYPLSLSNLRACVCVLLVQCFHGFRYFYEYCTTNAQRRVKRESESRLGAQLMVVGATMPQHLQEVLAGEADDEVHACT